MKWQNAVKDGVPAHGREVLVSYRGVNFIAVYDQEAKGFRVRGEENFFPVEEGNGGLYWSEIEPPVTKPC